MNAISPLKNLIVVALWVIGYIFSDALAANVALGPLAEEFSLTLSSGHRFEALGPFASYEVQGTQKQWAVPPLFSHTSDQATDAEEFDSFYPILTYDRFGAEYRFQILQLFSFAGGQNQRESAQRQFTLFPIYFQQRSPEPDLNYTAFVPFYGHLKNRLFRDEIRFAMFPVYGQSRKKDVVTDNFLYPIFHLRHGNGLKGWQFWPLSGYERKEITSQTDEQGETTVDGGHSKFFALWPFFFKDRTGTGTTNPVSHQALLPLYSVERSPARDSTSFFWPLGLTITDEREKNYHEMDMPWPLVVFARGEGKSGNRVWPLFGLMQSSTLESDFFLWPLYKFNRVHSPPLDRKRTRVLFFLYSDLTEKNEETGAVSQRTDLWPLFTAKRDREGNERFQLIAPLEIFLPENKSIQRNYSPLWSLWRSEKNGKTGATSQSFLWNAYRRDTTLETRKCSLLFGLFQYQSGSEGRRLRVFYIPLFKAHASPPDRSER